MPRLSPEAEGFGWAAGAINRAAQDHTGMRGAWQGVRQEMDRIGAQDLTGGFKAVTELYSLYATQRNGAALFEQANDGDLFSRSHAPEDINARDLADQGLFPEYLVRFDMDVTDELGEISTRTVTMRDTWVPDMTVGQVRDAVMQSAAGLSNDYGTTLVGVSNLRPVSI